MMECMEKDVHYHLKSIHLAKVREQLGGIKALDSSMMNRAISGLLNLGWDERQIAEAIELIWQMDGN